MLLYTDKSTFYSLERRVLRNSQRPFPCDGRIYQCLSLCLHILSATGEASESIYIINDMVLM